MAKTTVDKLIASARADPLFEQVYTSRKSQLRRSMCDALFALRKRAGLTPAELAERAGLQTADVLSIERGQKALVDALDVLAAIANATGSSLMVTFVDRRTEQVAAQAVLCN